MADTQEQSIEAVEVSNNSEATTEQHNDSIPVHSDESTASDMGWKPLSEWKGDPKDWRDAKTFVAMDPLYKQLSQQNKYIKSFAAQQALRDQEVHKFMANVEKATYEKARADVKAEMKLAIDNGDSEKVVELTERLSDMKEDQKIKQVQVPNKILDQPSQEELNQKTNDFVKRNSWYEQDEDMRVWANGKSTIYASRGMDIDQVLKQIEKDAKERFPEKFRNANRDKPSAVEGSSSANVKSETSTAGLNDFEIRIMKTTVANTKGMTEAQWKKDYLKFKGN